MAQPARAVPVVLLDHREGGADNLRYLERAHPIQQGLGDKAVAEGVEAGISRQACRDSRFFDELVPVAVGPRLAVIAHQKVGGSLSRERR